MQAAPVITCTACRTFWSSAAALICTRWPKLPICKAFWLRYRVRPGLRFWPRWPTLRELIELECDTSAVSNAARLIRVGAPATTVRNACRRDCSALTAAEWDYLLASPDLPAFKQRFAQTSYGPLLAHHDYTVLKEGFFRYRTDWCRKWLRFSTEPTLVMMCYIWLAQCEVWNLNHIIEGVHYKLPAEEVLALLIGYDEHD